MERNDLIRELTEIAEDRHGAKNTHLLSWLEQGYFHCQHGSEEWCQGDYLDSARAYIERLEAVAKGSLAAIATLSEALAEAEKREEDSKDAFFEYAMFHQDMDAAEELMAEGATFKANRKAARDLSQGGQHG